MSETKSIPMQDKPGSCLVHADPNLESKSSKSKFHFLRKKPSSKGKKEENTVKENKMPQSTQQVKDDSTKPIEKQTLKTKIKEASRLPDYKKSSAANPTQDENKDNVSVKSVNTLTSNTSKSIKRFFKSLRKNKSIKDSDPKEEKSDNVFTVFSKENDVIHKTALPTKPEEKERLLGPLDSNVLSTPSTPDTVRKISPIGNSQEKQETNPYESVYNTQSCIIMEDSLNFQPHTNKNMIKIYNILATETLNSTRDLSNGYVLSDLSETILSMLKENNRTHAAQIKIHMDKLAKQDREIFHLQMKLANLENQTEISSLTCEVPKQTSEPNKTFTKSVETIHNDNCSEDIKNPSKLTGESAKVKQLHNSLRVLEDTNAKLVIAQDGFRKEKIQLQKQKEFLACYKNYSIEFMSYLNSSFKGLVEEDSLKQYADFLKTVNTNDLLTNSMIFQSNHLTASKESINKFFNEIATGLIKDFTSKFAKSNQATIKLEEDLGKAKEVIFLQEKKLQDFHKNYQVALNPNISRSSIFVNEKYSDKSEEHIPMQPLFGP